VDEDEEGEEEEEEEGMDMRTISCVPDKGTAG